MVYIYSKLSKLRQYIGKKLTIEEITNTLMNLGMDIKGQTDEKDPELKIEITAEKIDMVSTLGIARSIKHYLQLKKTIPKYQISNSNKKLIVENNTNIRPKIVAAIIKNVPMNEETLKEIIEIQEKIHQSFGRNRKKGAIGIYPLEKVSFPVYYKVEKPEKITFHPLESTKELNGLEIIKNHPIGKKYSHLLKNYEKYPIVTDSNNNILSMPPIINSHKTGRVEKKHKDLFIECTGYNLKHIDNILKILVTTFIDMGATAENVSVEYKDQIYKLNLESHKETFDLDKIQKLIGIDIDKNELKTSLSKMMYDIISIENKKITVEYPTFKNDVWNDVDIADDIARGYGFNNIIPKTPQITSVGEKLKFTRFKENITKIMTNLGFIETYTYMLTSTKNQFENMNRQEKEYIKLTKSIDQGLNMIRNLILPESLTTLKINSKNKLPQKIFENGFIIIPDKTQDTKAKNQSNLNICIEDLKANYTQIKAILDTISKLLKIDFTLKESKIPFLINGRQAKIYIQKTSSNKDNHDKNNESKIEQEKIEIGFIGELHPQILNNFSLKAPIATLEINLNKLYELTTTT